MASTTSKPKQIVYLLGAGATQGEVDHLGAERVNLLMRDSEMLGEGVSTRILRRVSRAWRTFLGEDHGIDIEKLISLLAASGVDGLSSLAEKIRQYYFLEIRTSLVDADVISRPTLAIGLLEMHRDNKFKAAVETLSGVITTNHDGLLQIASQNVFDGLKLGFPFSSKDFTVTNAESVPPILQLHGSFTWGFGTPIDVSRLHSKATYSADTVWIPPSILKDPKNYPFNKVTALAYEFLA